jgi:hypothetical protein
MLPRGGNALEFSDALSELFNLVGDRHFVSVLHCYLDESGKFQEHPIVSLCGFVGERTQIGNFQVRWEELLRFYGMRSMSMAKAARFTQPLGKRKAATGLDNRKAALSNFIECITDNLPVAVHVAVDVASFNSLTDHQKTAMGGGPHYLAFMRVIAEIVDYHKHPGIQLSVVCDDDQSSSPKCYAIFDKIRSKHPQYRRKIVSLCFADDEYFVPLQAADMFAYLVRREAERHFLGKTDHQFRCLFEQIANPPRGRKPTLLGGFYSKDKLQSLAARVR